MNHSILFRISLLICLLHLPACAIKGYSGPDLPDNQLATVEIKAPTASLIPLFWIFPLNMLTWFSEDWFETSWSGSDITVNPVSIEDEDFLGLWTRAERRKVVLDRFNQVKLLPKNYQIATEKSVITNRVATGSQSCSTSSCTCTTDDKKKKTCSQTTTCSTPYKITAHDYICQLSINAKAGMHYKAFIRDSHLMVEGSDSTQFNDQSCFWGPFYSYSTTESSSSTNSCSY